jgi:hypothetical protein
MAPILPNPVHRFHCRARILVDKVADERENRLERTGVDEELGEEAYGKCPLAK